jgi:hypothetical protein
MRASNNRSRFMSNSAAPSKKECFTLFFASTSEIDTFCESSINTQIEIVKSINLIRQLKLQISSLNKIPAPTASDSLDDKTIYKEAYAKAENILENLIRSKHKIKSPDPKDQTMNKINELIGVAIRHASLILHALKPATNLELEIPAKRTPGFG